MFELSSQPNLTCKPMNFPITIPRLIINDEAWLILESKICVRQMGAIGDPQAPMAVDVCPAHLDARTSTITQRGHICVLRVGKCGAHPPNCTGPHAYTQWGLYSGHFRFWKSIILKYENNALSKSCLQNHLGGV